MRGITVYLPDRLSGHFHELWSELQAIYGEDVLVIQEGNVDTLRCEYESGTEADEAELRERIWRIAGELPE